MVINNKMADLTEDTEGDASESPPPAKRIKTAENGGGFLTEKDVGITKYVNKNGAQIFAILKQRHSSIFYY